MGSLIRSDDFGKMLVFNTHLCASCPPEQRQDQIEAALRFVDTIFDRYGDIPVIFAGDFNIRETDAGVPPVDANYNAIVSTGFVDTYAKVKDCIFGGDPDAPTAPCCNPTVVTHGCTSSVVGNHYGGGDTTRVDYIFYRPENKLKVSQSDVVFNSTPFISDHCGVKTVFEQIK